jgi:putative transposase
VLKAWGLPRSTFYERRRRPLCPRPPARRGPKTRYSDEDLLAEIRRTIQESPFHGEGHRKVWARLRVREVRTSMRRVLRLMRENDLLAPQRQPQPVEPKRHDGTILAERPNQMWGIDATVGFTVAEGRVAIFAMVDHATADVWAFTSPSAARGLRRWNRSARRCVNSLAVSQKTSLAASDSGMITARNS